MARSSLRRVVSRVWKAVKPPPAPLPRRRLNPAQRRLIRGTAIAVALGAGTWAVFAYIASAPDRASSHYREGMRLLGPGDLGGAAAQFTEAIDILPDYADAYIGRGKAHQSAGQSDAALADFERAIALNPTLELAYALRGTLWRSQRDTGKALADFTRSIHLHPTSDGYYQRGLTYQSLDQLPRAVDDFSLAISYDPGAPHIYRARAKARRDLGDIAGARQDQENAERLERTQ